MSLLFALMLVQAGATALPPPGDEEIVVIAQVNRISTTLGRDGAGKVFCSITHSSGDPALDDFTCRDLARCIKRKPEPREKVDACIAKRKQQLAKAWLRHKGHRE